MHRFSFRFFGAVRMCIVNSARKDPSLVFPRPVPQDAEHQKPEVRCRDKA
jgi:hypothetical protein